MARITNIDIHENYEFWAESYWEGNEPNGDLELYVKFPDDHHFIFVLKEGACDVHVFDFKDRSPLPKKRLPSDAVNMMKNIKGYEDVKVPIQTDGEDIFMRVANGETYFIDLRAEDEGLLKILDELLAMAKSG